MTERGASSTARKSYRFSNPRYEAIRDGSPDRPAAAARLQDFLDLAPLERLAAETRSFEARMAPEGYVANARECAAAFAGLAPPPCAAAYTAMLRGALWPYDAAPDETRRSRDVSGTLDAKLAEYPAARAANVGRGPRGSYVFVDGAAGPADSIGGLALALATGRAVVFGGPFPAGAAAPRAFGDAFADPPYACAACETLAARCAGGRDAGADAKVATADLAGYRSGAAVLCVGAGAAALVDKIARNPLSPLGDLPPADLLGALTDYLFAATPPLLVL